jgi:hypothetical protein
MIEFVDDKPVVTRFVSESSFCNSKHLSTALKLMAEVHENQVDKAGVPYVAHPVGVAALCTTIDEFCLGLIHDVVEDSSLTIEEISRCEIFPTEIIKALDAISKREGESREDYLKRVSQNDLAYQVKWNDIINNTDPDRLALLPPTTQDFLVEKYQEAKYLLRTYRSEVLAQKELGTKNVVDLAAYAKSKSLTKVVPNPIYLHDWSIQGNDGGLDQLVKDFAITKETVTGINILLASYTYQDYSGTAFILYEKDGKYFEVNAGHCSCYGLEGQWETEEADLKELQNRANASKSWEMSDYKTELLAILGDLLKDLPVEALIN